MEHKTLSLTPAGIAGSGSADIRADLPGVVLCFIGRMMNETGLYVSGYQCNTVIKTKHHGSEAAAVPTCNKLNCKQIY